MESRARVFTEDPVPFLEYFDPPESILDLDTLRRSIDRAASSTILRANEPAMPFSIMPSLPTSVWKRLIGCHLRDNLAIDAVTGIFRYMVNEERETKLPASPIPSFYTGALMEVLHEAIIDRIKLVVRMKPPEYDTMNGDIKAEWELWWFQWQRLSDQFFAFVSFALINIEGFLRQLKTRRLSSIRDAPLGVPEDFSDTGIIYMFSQAVVVERLKTMLIADSLNDDFQQKRKLGGTFVANVAGELLDTIKSFLPTYHDNTKISFGNLALTALLLTTRQHSNDFTSPAHETLARMVKHLESKLTMSVDFAAFSWTERQVLCMKSCVSNDNVPPFLNHYLTHPNRRPSSDLQALPVQFLACLPATTRYSILQHLEKDLISANPSPTPLGIGAQEAFARLAYVSPTLFQKDRFINSVKQLKGGPRITTIANLINFRLFRFYLSNMSIDRVADAFQMHVAQSSGAEQSLCVQNLQIKLALHVSSVVPFRVAGVDYGEAMLRFLPYLVSRCLQIRGFSDPQAVEECFMVLRSHYQSSGVVPAISTQKYFPANMQQIMSTWKRFAPPHVEAARLEMGEIKKGAAATRSFYANAGVDAKIRIPCAAFMFLSQAPANSLTFNHETASVLLEALNGVAPQLIGKSDFLLIDMLVVEYGNQPFVARDFETVAKLIWQWRLLSHDNLLLALAYHADSEKAKQLIKYLLFAQDSQYRARVDEWCRLCGDNSPTPVVSVGQILPFWLRDDLRLLNEYKKKFGVSDSSQYCEIERLVPVFDILIGRLIEENCVDLLVEVVQGYGKFYAFHPAPTTFVVNTMHYYSTSHLIQTDLGVKFTCMFSLLTTDETTARQLNLCQTFVDYLHKPTSDYVFPPDFFAEITQSIFSALQPEIQEEQSPYSCFAEFGGRSAVRYTMLCASLQFLFANAHLQWKQYDKVAASLIAAVPNSASTWLWHAPPSRIVASVTTGEMGEVGRSIADSPAQTFSDIPRYFKAVLPCLLSIRVLSEQATVSMLKELLMSLNVAPLYTMSNSLEACEAASFCAQVGELMSYLATVLRLSQPSISTLNKVITTLPDEIRYYMKSL